MSPLGLVLLAALLGGPCPSARCVCAADGPDDAGAVLSARNDADAVFLGRVVRIERIRLPGDADAEFGDWREATFEVSRSWKGGNDARTRVRTPWHAALCGFPFERGGEYLIYARVADDGRLRTDACTRTRTRARAGEDLLHLEALVGRVARAHDRDGSADISRVPLSELGPGR